MVQTSCRVALAVVLLAAAAGKAYQATVDPLASEELFGSRWIVLAAVCVELYGALWLASGRLGKAARHALTLLFLALAGVACALGLAGRSTCGCLGAIDFPISPWLALGFDLSAALFVWRAGDGNRPSPGNNGVQADDPLNSLECSDGNQPFPSKHGSARLRTVTALWSLVVAPVTYLVATAQPARLDAQGIVTGRGTVRVSPKQWLGRPLPVARFLSTPEPVAQGKWLVLFVQPDCPKCAAVVSAIGPMLSSDSDRRGLLVNVGTAALRSDLPGFLEASLTRDHTWLIPTPLVVHLSGGIVESVSADAGISAHD